MNPDGRMDDALRSIAQAEASQDFAVHVRARLESGEQERTAWWPRVATAGAAVLMVAVTWLAREAPPEPSGRVARATAPAVTSRPGPPLPQLEPRPEAAATTPGGRRSRLSNPVARVTTTALSTSDHDRALEPLSPLAALSVPSIAPDAMVVVDHVIVPLAPIAPLSAVHDAIGDVDRGEL